MRSPERDGTGPEARPSWKGTTLVGVVGTIDRGAGAEKAYWSISTGLRERLGFRLVQASQLAPTRPLGDDRELHVLRPDGQRLFRWVAQLLKLRRLLAAVPRPAILFPFQVNTNILAVAANASLPVGRRLPVVVNDRANIRTTTTPTLRLGLAFMFRLLVVRWMGRWAYRRSRFVVCNSKANAAQVREFLGPNAPPVVAIANPVPVEEIQQRFAERDRSVLLDPGRPVIAGHGRLYHGKGWEMLITVLAEVQKEFPGARLRILGEGVLLGELEALAEKMGVRSDCEFPGFVEDPLPAIESADVYVLASESEGMPNSLLEAIALGMPCISTDCPTGPAEILGEDGRVGRLVPVGAAEEMAEAIVEMLRDGERRQILARAARARARDFRTEVCVEAYVQVLAECLPQGAIAK